MHYCKVIRFFGQYLKGIFSLTLTSGVLKGNTDTSYSDTDYKKYWKHCEIV